MLEVTPRLIFLVVFLAGLAAFLYKDRNKIQRSSILFYRRTKSGIDKIDAIQKRFPRFWKAYGWGAAISGVVTMFIAAIYIGRQFAGVFRTGSVQESGISFVAPALVAESSFQPGLSLIPVEYWIISIGIVMTVHELSHGIVARSEDFEINSVGWIILGIFPGAFVEPKGERMLPDDNEEHMQEDEEEEDGATTAMWDQGSLSSRIKVLGAGSFANYLTAIIFLLAGSLLMTSVSHPGDIYYGVEENSSAAMAGMNNGTIYSINGTQISSSQQIVESTSGLQPGQQITFNTSEGVFSFEAGQRTYRPRAGIPGIITVPTGPERTEGHVGIRFAQVPQIDAEYEAYSGFLMWFISLLETVAILNLGIGLVNMLPIKPLDGGQIMGGVIDKYIGGNGTKAFNYISLAGMILLLGIILLSIGSAL